MAAQHTVGTSRQPRAIPCPAACLERGREMEGEGGKGEGGGERT